jgi:hypothetical protein
MRRRIERSRARCEKAATTKKTDKEQESEKQSKLTVSASLSDDEGGS